MPTSAADAADADASPPEALVSGESERGRECGSARCSLPSKSLRGNPDLSPRSCPQPERRLKR